MDIEGKCAGNESPFGAHDYYNATSYPRKNVGDFTAAQCRGV